MSDWRPIETAPLNEYGQRWGPVILVFCDADKLPWTVYYDPQFNWEYFDTGPAWIIPDSDGMPLHPFDVTHWMPLPEEPNT